MKIPDEERIQGLLKNAMRSMDSELKRDLWPEMLRRLDARLVQVPWFDWALVALAAICCVAFPGALSGLLYHL